MHGISKEILKLARASSALHAVADRGRRLQAAFFDRFDRSDPEYPSARQKRRSESNYRFVDRS